MPDRIDDPADPSGRLISASLVRGTGVYNHAGDKLGTVHDVMIDKASGRSEYAIMSFGGFLGLGERYHPLPWNILHYDRIQGGYVVDLSRDVLEGAPAYDTDNAVAWGDDAWGQRIDDYYGVRRGEDLVGGIGAESAGGVLPIAR